MSVLRRQRRIRTRGGRLARAGDTALIETVRALGPDFAHKDPVRELTFLWATRQELGLEGAAAYAARVAVLRRIAFPRSMV